MNALNHPTSPDTAGPARQAGFTLLELMIVVVIVAILAAAAIPHFGEHVKRAKRAEAQILLLQAAARQDRYFSDNNSYTTSATDLGYSPATDPCTQSTNPCSNNENYELTMDAGATGAIVTSYILTVTPLAPHDDGDCGSLTFDSRQAQGSSTGNARCWR